MSSAVKVACVVFVSLVFSCQLQVASAVGYRRQAHQRLQTAYTEESQVSSYQNDAGGTRAPYNFGYKIKDEQGNEQHRQESGDESGAVVGSYGYTDAYGLYRRVKYVADHNGFRAYVVSNEPGLTDQQPADVNIQVDGSANHSGDYAADDGYTSAEENFQIADTAGYDGGNSDDGYGASTTHYDDVNVQPSYNSLLAYDQRRQYAIPVFRSLRTYRD